MHTPRRTYGYLGALYLLQAAINYLQSYGHQPSPNQCHQLMHGQLWHSCLGPPVSIKYATACHSNVLCEILAVETSLPIQMQRHHVKSHQANNNAPLEDLTPPIRINKM